MKKLLILSGKGGTGKTTTAASFIRFSKAKAIADCDVDAPNLHLVTSVDAPPQETVFFGSDKSMIDAQKCIGCGLCAKHCRFGAIHKTQEGRYAVSEYACEGCGVCAAVCPQGAAALAPDASGTLTLHQGETVFSTAKLKMGRGNSGKLVTAVKTAMARTASGAPFAVIDGSPGIGCPVIASVTGTDLVLIVAEPSVSGISDLERILKTTQILGTHAAVCVNKYNQSEEKAQQIEQLCTERDIPFVGKIPYDKNASAAANTGRSVADIDCPARDALYEVYKNTMAVLDTL